ncbi:protein lifeguard 4 isoform X2 [Hydra vulgaris]|uniref:Protein lifeguard 4 isoform X2 n=1 Tax=Hydra vulgaris TaxID=6087 RepID=A0ABM4DJA3_HYDVU
MVDIEGSFSKNERDDFYSVTVAQSSLQVRLGFIRKVYGILSTQLFTTTLVGALFMYNDNIKQFVQQSPNLLLFGLIATIGLIIALGIKRKDSPTNFYLLAAFTLIEAYTVGTIVTFYDQFIVLEAFGLTMAVVVALTIYTFQSKKDFSAWGAGLFAMLWIIVLAGFLQIFIRNEMFELILAVAGAILFAGFIVFDTHMMIHKLSPEEYILAAINLYLDIINLFLEILKILNAAKRN